MSSVFLSYIVPCYNVQEFLPRCIESLERQTDPSCDVEFILVNDGSKDRTPDIIRQFASRDSRVVVIDQPNQGVCAARNNGLAIARGEYVFFLDGDDWLTDDASSLMYSFCKDAKPDIAIFSNYQQREGSANVKPWYTSTDDIAPGIYATGDYVEQTVSLPISCKLFRRAFLKEQGIVFDKSLVAGEVHTFFVHALSLSETVGVSSDHIMYYLKRRGQSATTSINVERDLTILNTLHVLNGYAGNNSVKFKDKRAFLLTTFWLVTAFALIKYVGQTKYKKELGVLLSSVKKDQDYKALLKYFTGEGLSRSKHSLLAVCIRFMPPRLAYGIIRGYYRWATRNRE